MKNGLLQAKDVNDLAVLQVIAELMAESYRRRPAPDEYLWTMRWDIEKRFPAIPEKVMRAKFAALVRRKLIDGCTCGCRGDFWLLPAGRAALQPGGATKEHEQK